MTTFTHHALGSPCWVDLMTPDPDGGAAFVAALFGWEAKDELDDDGRRVYITMLKDGKEVAGIGETPPGMEGMPAVWNTYIAVDDPATTVEAVTAAGGQVMMPPMPVMDAGVMAVCADPTGAAFSLWKALDTPGAQLCNVADTWSWNELLTRDIDAALPFYSSVFGWEYDAIDMGPMGTYNVIRGGENDGWGGLMAMPAGMPDQVPNHWMVYFSVADLEASLAKATAAGGHAMGEPMEIPNIGTSCVLHHGAAGSFTLLQPLEMPA